MIKPEQPRIEVDDLAAAISESIAAQKHYATPAFANGSSAAKTQTPELALQPDFQPRSTNRYHISDLLRYHDRAFVENSYRAILKRPPDATEFARDLKRLRSGDFNKIDLLAMLRYSTEGKAKGVELEGLSMPALVRRLGHLPVIGYFLRFAIALVRLPNQVRDQREFAGYVLSQNQQIADFVNVVSARVAEVNHGVSRLEEALSKQIALLDRQLAENQKIESRIENERELIQSQFEKLRIETELLSSTLHREAEKGRNELTQAISQQQTAVDMAVGELRAEIDRVYSRFQQVRTELSLQTRNLSSVIAPATIPTLTVPVLPGSNETHRLDALYAALEDRFRGTREEIKERFRIYLPYVEPVRDALVIDLGCGRGEWLELLKDVGIAARGVEKNRVSIDQCCERGLDVVEADMIAYLRTLADASAGAITGFHIIEHVPIDALVALLDEVMRVLRPGGVVIFETPNPENVLVGSNFFYLDPTHRHPLPSELTQFLLDNRGFHPVEVLKLHPWDAGRVEGRSELAERFNGYFFGPMDYAILGWKVDTTKSPS
jgi:O-antigen chain-terminating methyltransferase